MYKKFILFAIVLLTIVSCEKTYDPGATKAKDVANEWWADLYQGGASATGGSIGKVMTYNTAVDNDSIWVDDLHNLYSFKVKAKFDSKALTFVTTNAKDDYYDPLKPAASPATVTITDGKVLLKAAHSATGVVTDSIYFKAEFSDDPGTIYEIKGTGRTGWAEDDY